MVIRGEYLSKGISHLKLAVKGKSFLAAIARISFQKGWVTVEMLGNWGMVIVLKAGFETILGRVKHHLWIFERSATAL